MSPKTSANPAQDRGAERCFSPVAQRTEQFWEALETGGGCSVTGASPGNPVSPFFVTFLLRDGGKRMDLICLYRRPFILLRY